ncbi:hypothetical protein H6P81_017733 [Aristolochia fimbriata]|uniref:Uncharacterized protein n=1 Tax=Aristolochia fimbriata TaxID=158543 RepID=A0AAV7E0T7_ARIFI|nr:hypothetical protein H6P81_017733 [Aristolochia fimbriata]
MTKFEKTDYQDEENHAQDIFEQDEVCNLHSSELDNIPLSQLNHKCPPSTSRLRPRHTTKRVTTPVETPIRRTQARCPTSTEVPILVDTEPETEANEVEEESLLHLLP